MSLSDPITVATDPAAPFSKIWSPNPSQSVFRKEFPTGDTVTLTFTQAQTKTRKRHLARVDHARGAANADGTFTTVSFTLTIDEPILYPLSDTDMVYYCNVLMNTCNDTVLGKLLNGEL
jgi:hypothetical protein